MQGIAYINLSMIGTLFKISSKKAFRNESPRHQLRLVIISLYTKASTKLS